MRARFDESTVTVYQAYSVAIAESALAAGRFVAPFRFDRMTWIKPSFLWMMYRSGWATKAGQERILSIEITRQGFEWAIAHACLSHFDPDVHTTIDKWRRALASAPVRVQWDPERSATLQPLRHRAIQIGLSGDASQRYANDWTISIREVTDLARSVQAAVTAGDEHAAVALLPEETPYPLADDLRSRIGADV